jgi:arylsulfatase A-like enzyme
MSIIDLLKKGVHNPEKISPYISQQLIKKPLGLRYNLNQMNIYERDWDLLIILDACRVDAIEAVSSEYEFLPETVQHSTSVGGGSPTWLANTFTEEWTNEINDTGYISANPHTRRVLSDQTEGLFADRGGYADRISDFDHFSAVWETQWDAELGTVPARAVTDYLIRYYRSQPSHRTIAHYMQPHFPSVPTPLGEGMNISDDAKWHSKDTWTLVRQGKVSEEEAYAAYMDNLRYVLDEVKMLLSNISAEKVVITADHGNAFGEWGEYSHGQSFIGAVRDVPWIRTCAQDEGEYTPEIETNSGDNSQSVEEKLQALGYKI